MVCPAAEPTALLAGLKDVPLSRFSFECNWGLETQYVLKENLWKQHRELQLQRQLPKQQGNTGCLVEPKSRRWRRQNSTCEPTQQVLGIVSCSVRMCTQVVGGGRRGGGSSHFCLSTALTTNKPRKINPNSKPEACFLLDASVFPSL